MEVEFEILERKELKEAVAFSLKAYEDYAYFVNFFPDIKERLRVLWAVMYRAWLTTFKKARFLVAKVDGKMVGLAVLEPPHYKRPSVFQFLIHGWLQVYWGVNVRRMNNWIAMDEAAGKPCHDYQKSSPDIWYMSSLTVDPAFQGKGVGTKLIAFTEYYLRERSADQLVLFTNSEKNLAFYKNRGFEVFHECEIAHDGKIMGSWSVKKKV